MAEFCWVENKLKLFGCEGGIGIFGTWGNFMQLDQVLAIAQVMSHGVTPYDTISLSVC